MEAFDYSAMIDPETSTNLLRNLAAVLEFLHEKTGFRFTSLSLSLSLSQSLSLNHSPFSRSPLSLSTHTEAPLEFCVKAIQVLNVMSYRAPHDVRVKIKDMSLMDTRSLLVVTRH